MTGLIIGAAVLVVLVVVLLVVQKQAKKYEDAQDAKDSLITETSDEISRISYTAKGAQTVNISRSTKEVEVTASDTSSADESGIVTSAGDTSSTATKTENIWVDDDDASASLDTSKCDTLASSLTGVSITQTLKHVTDLSLYGLDSPSYTVNLTFKDGSTQTITIGNTNDAASAVYCYLGDDTSTVYAVSTSLTSDLGDTISDLTATSTASS